MNLIIKVAASVAGLYAIRRVLESVIWPEGAEMLRKRFPYPFCNIAHRGGSLIGPENTLYTFRKAMREGADMLELDVHRSKDGKIVVSHDGNLRRTCGTAFGNVEVSDIVVGTFPDDTLPQSARQISLCFKADDVREYIATADVPRDSSTRLCLLSEVLDEFPDVPIHLDVKEVGFEVIKQVLDMVELYKRESTTFFGSSSSENAVYIRQYFQESSPEKRERFRLFANTADYFKVYFYYYCGILPFIKIDFDVFSIPIFTPTMMQDIKQEHGYIVSKIASYLLTTPGLWRHLQRRGIAVIGWVLNTEADFKEASALPLNGIISDDPICLCKFLRTTEKNTTRNNYF